MLIFSYLLVMVLLAYSQVMIVRGANEQLAAQRFQARAQAFQVAEGGLDDAIQKLRADYNWTGPITAAMNGTGTYTVSATQSGSLRTIQSTSSTTNGTTTLASFLTSVVRRLIPPNFYDNAIYSADEIRLTGGASQVVGDVLTGSSETIEHAERIQGTVTHDPTASPLPRLDFRELYEIALRQGNIYDDARLRDIQRGWDAFPNTFCYLPPLNPNTPCEPNVNYVTTDLVLNGNIGTIGGFFVVVGNVLTDPNAVEDTTINGNGQIAGVVYTTGEFRINGGGNGLNVDGGVFAGSEGVRLNGNATIQYNQSYLQAVENLHVNPDVQVVLWRECAEAGCP